ncbi:hypothetical protein LTS18_014173, partial [Coniosporium uncinatum]
LTSEFDLAALVEEVCEAVCAGQAFRKTHSEYGGDLSQQLQDAAQHPLLKILTIVPRTNWNVRTQPGAIRRIIMNLVGNALKYTDQGFVSVFVTVEEHPDPEKMAVRMQISDSGRGMSMEYQRTSMFSPFSQEDPFANGTGLGLSIVRQLLDSLNGSIEVKSTKGFGTVVDVRMSLTFAGETTQMMDEDHTLAARREITRNLHLCLLKSSQTASDKISEARERLLSSMQNVCTQWFEMNVTEALSFEEASRADLVLCPTSQIDMGSFISDAKRVSSGTTAFAILCADPAEEVLLKSKGEEWLSHTSRFIEIASQP